MKKRSILALAMSVLMIGAAFTGCGSNTDNAGSAAGADNGSASASVTGRTVDMRSRLTALSGSAYSGGQAGSVRLC